MTASVALGASRGGGGHFGGCRVEARVFGRGGMNTGGAPLYWREALVILAAVLFDGRRSSGRHFQRQSGSISMAEALIEPSLSRLRLSMVVGLGLGLGWGYPYGYYGYGYPYGYGRWLRLWWLRLRI